MKLEEGKKLIKSILESVGVSIVYYIDDYLSNDGLQSIITYIEEASEEELQNHASIIPEQIIDTKSFNPDIRDTIQTWWETLSNAKREEVICQCAPSQVSQAESQIQQLFGDKCVMCSPLQWEDKYSSTCLEKIRNGEKALLLFDQRLGAPTIGDGESRTGLSLAQSFSGNEGVKENSYCGIFSQSFGREEEFKFRNENREQLSSWAFPLSKKRMPSDDDYTLFIEGLNNLFWVGYVDNLSDIAKNLIEETSQKISDEFGKILPSEFKQMVIDSSSEEGCREIDTLLRLIHIIFHRELQGALSRTKDGMKAFNHGVEHIKEIDSMVSKSIKKNLQVPSYDAEAIHKFFQDENFIPGNVVNNLLMPLQNGDVFCVNNSSYYVLLCQPCTISIRKNGRRGGNGIGYFVPLEESKAEYSIEKDLAAVLSKNGDAQEKAKVKLRENIHCKLKSAAQGYSYKVKCSINNKSLCASMNKYTPIHLSLLDYSTFSEDGQVVINKECSPNLHQNQKQLNENHAIYFKNIMDLDNLVSGLNEDCHVVVKNKIENWFYSLLTKLGVKPRFENCQYFFPIKRYGHIQEPLSSDLLTQLSHYISRAGLPSEFER